MSYAKIIKLGCPCGGTFEANAEDGDGLWVKAQAHRWSQAHQDCPKLFAARPDGRTAEQQLRPTKETLPTHAAETGTPAGVESTTQTK